MNQNQQIMVQQQQLQQLLPQGLPMVPMNISQISQQYPLNHQNRQQIQMQLLSQFQHAQTLQRQQNEWEGMQNDKRQNHISVN